jgi:CBS domain containing-hemolysin-like protein
MFGVQEASHAEVLSGEEIKGLVATSQEYGEIEKERADMLHNLCEFDQRQVGRVMIPRNKVHSLDISASADTNLVVIRETAHSRFPVIDSARGDAIIGILLAKDIQRALLSGESEPWRDLQKFSREPLLVPESQRVAQLFERMRQKRAHMALVVDEYGAFVGAVTLEDLLEEIVGEIHDETDDEGQTLVVESIADRRWESDGLVSLVDLEKAVGLSVPVELDANTLSGLILERLTRMPEVGDEVQEGEYRLQVLSLQECRVARVAIERCNPTADSPKSSKTGSCEAGASAAEPERH